MTVPIQRKSSAWIRLLKRLLKLQVVKHVAFNLGLRGFNRVGYQVIKFKGYDKDGNKVYEKPGLLHFVYNSRVDKGAALQASLMAGSALGGCVSPAVPLYIALSTSSLTPAKGDITLAGETSAAGLARALGAAQNYVAPSVVDGAASFDIYKQFTNTSAGAVTVVSSALFDANGNMFAEANLAASAALGVNDILQLTWTVNI